MVLHQPPCPREQRLYQLLPLTLAGNLSSPAHPLEIPHPREGAGPSRRGLQGLPGPRPPGCTESSTQPTTHIPTFSKQVRGHSLLLEQVRGAQGRPSDLAQPAYRGGAPESQGALLGGALSDSGQGHNPSELAMVSPHSPRKPSFRSARETLLPSPGPAPLSPDQSISPSLTSIRSCFQQERI